MVGRLPVRVLGLLSALTLTGCGGGGMQPGTAAPGATQPSVAALTESEFKIEPKTVVVKAGSVTFQVRNAGTIEHNFIIERTTVDVEGIQPGHLKTVTITLRPGTYKMLCTVPGHAEAGMVGSIQVSP